MDCSGFLVFCTGNSLDSLSGSSLWSLCGMGQLGTRRPSGWALFPLGQEGEAGSFLFVWGGNA